ncbi:hypothetical protein RyT2_18710 [Pseudolactococcus yaeyamensis]
MGTIIEPASVKTQAKMTIESLKVQNDSLESILPKIGNFENESELDGKAWRGLKSHMGAHRSVIQGLICANESAISDNEALETLSGSDKLDEDKIREDIERIKVENVIITANIASITDTLNLESNVRAESKSGDGRGYDAYDDDDSKSPWNKYVEKQGGVWKLK